MKKIYNERKQNKELLYEEFEIALYLTYIMNANIISEEGKKSLIEKAFLRLFKEDMRILSETDNKKLIK